MTPLQQKIEKTLNELRKEWAEKAHEHLENCGFQKTNYDHPETPSTTKRSEALAFQALMLVFVSDLFSAKLLEIAQWSVEQTKLEEKEIVAIQQEKIKEMGL